MKNKALTLTIAMFSLSLILVGCGKSDDKGNSQAAVKIESGSYIVPDSANVSQTKGDKGYLALKVSVQNKTDDDFYATSSDFKLLDKDGHKISSKDDVYMSDDDDFKTLSEKIDGGDHESGYVVFPVNKKAKYTLKYLPDVTSGDSKAIKMNVNASKYKDNSKQAEKALEAYVNNIFLGKKDGNYSKLVANDQNEEKDNYNDKLKDQLDDTFIDANLNDDQVKKAAEALQKVNADRATIEYKIESATADQATISLKTKTVPLDDVSKQADDAVDDAIDNTDDDLADIYVDTANKAIDHLGDILKNTDLKNSSDITVKLEKEDGKWKIDSEDDGFDSFVNPFIGSDY